ncbi:hypothetical protein ACLB2K_003236 [Fragaria x ananassa]
MADRGLPDELIEMIREYLDPKTRMHVAQFRAVSKSWRSFIPSFNPLKPPPQDHPLLPSRFGIHLPTESLYTIQRSIVYHIAPYPPPHHNDERKRGWLMRLDTNQKLLPLLSWRDGGLENPRVMINSLDFGVREVARPYLLARGGASPGLTGLEPRLSLSVSQSLSLSVSVSVSPYSQPRLTPKAPNPFILCRRSRRSLLPLAAAALAGRSRSLAAALLASCRCSSQSGSDSLRFFLNLHSSVMLVRDGVLYLGKWSYRGVKVKQRCVQLTRVNPDEDDVSQSGKAAAMDSSFKWEVIAFPVPISMWDKKKKKYLVESLRELLLVERHGSTFVAKGHSEEDMLTKEVKFKVYKLDGNWKQWIEMEGSDLDDRMLVVGEDCCFSVSSRDFPGCQGNCVLFSYEVWRGKTIFSKIGVFHLDVGTASSLEAGTNIFRSPPLI